MKQRRVIRLVQARSERKASEAKHVRKVMHACVRRSFELFGDDISGFALVSWNRRGEMDSAYLVGHGPHAFASIPGQVHDALNRHMAVELAQDCQPTFIDGDEPEGA